ncbi:lipoprotein-anchoring transpeptidase ErfK/SrfK [Tardiphaga robiniae]|uniref:L,D-transpeptidase n=1 Tax=Tardiphaga robiniae TaxID=943830 RepID=UPI0028652C05|nr:L,D-transpeptidase family protein [Tardiphaga robiniae]MDR6660684.1 lipoprotein-anchoring transpeptidase ErfK/SrfK [Tardiphaga robiniae]
MGAFQLSREPGDNCRFLSGTIFSGSFLRIALVAMAGMTVAAPADAAVFWTDENPMIMREIEPPAPQPQQRQKKLKRLGAKLEKQVKEHAKPVGPLVIAISIERQSLRVFDANGLFAETPISTGMRGHSTPMGVFSIIQKNKWHRSNIYSGAPMPYMQRITWSGIALHAGALPGYPASHGCIRMPMAFATRIWGWTRMGARVIIAPGEISPAEISHPLLAAQKAAPGPVAAAAPQDVQASPKADKASADAKLQDLGLRPSAADRSKTQDKTQTADASNAMTKPAPATVMSDATPTKVETAVKAAEPEIMTRRDLDAAIAKVVELPTPEVKSAETVAEAPAKLEPAKTEAPKAEIAKADVAPVAASVPDAKKDETRPADAAKAEMSTASPAPAADATPKRSGQIAVLVSGKDGKLYVRQNFAPLFETPIAIKPSDRPLGTHIFTARTDKDDAKAFHWTAVSLPAVPRRADEDDNVSRRRKSTGAVEVKTRPLPNSAAEALDRLTIPADAMAQITEALASGGSIVVSDQGIAAGGETGQGTEFVVPLR